MQVYDPLTNSWTPLPNFTFGRSIYQQKTKKCISILFSFRTFFSLAVVGGKLTAASNSDFEVLEDEGWTLKNYNGPTPPFLHAVSYALVPN